jgi:hypothetical protein
LLIRYSLVPSRYSRRVTAISAQSRYSRGSSCAAALSELSNVIVTSAMPWGPRFDEPAKMTSVIERPRRCRALCSPMHQRIESTMFDFPQPFGPTMPTTSWSKWMTVRSTNDLKPEISSFLMCMVSSVSWVPWAPIRRGRPPATERNVMPWHVRSHDVPAYTG